MIPDQIPYRKVLHDFEGSDEPFGMIVGEAKQVDDWMTDEELEKWERDLERREKARRKLGGFGFHR